MERRDQFNTKNAVPKQEVDERRALFNAHEADLNAADASLKRYEQMRQYLTITEYPGR